MRLFVAVSPPERARSELCQAVAPLRAAHPEIRWTDPIDWHLTLAFLGEVAQERRAELAARLAGVAARSAPFAVKIEGSGCFGSRVLWAGVAGAVQKPHGLADAVRGAVDAVGLTRDLRALHPHLTLAYGWRRERDAAGQITGAPPRNPADVTPLRDALADFHGGPWNVDRLLLMSTGGSGASRYAILDGWALDGLSVNFGEPRRSAR